MKEERRFQRSRTMRAVVRALDDMQLIPVPDGFHEAVMARLMLGVPVEIEVEEQPHGHRGLFVFAGAAGVGVGVAIGVAAWRYIVGHDRGDKMAAVGST